LKISYPQEFASFPPERQKRRFLFFFLQFFFIKFDFLFCLNSGLKSPRIRSLPYSDFTHVDIIIYHSPHHYIIVTKQYRPENNCSRNRFNFIFPKIFNLFKSFRRWFLIKMAPRFISSRSYINPAQYIFIWYCFNIHFQIALLIIISTSLLSYIALAWFSSHGTRTRTLLLWRVCLSDTILASKIPIF